MEHEPFDPEFPVEALMSVLGGAVNYIQSKNQTPVEMCACSVLSASALLCQGLFDVEWRAGKISPTSLIILVEALTGERKSANDDEAYPYIRLFDAEQEILEKASDTAYAEEHKLWAAMTKELRKAIAKLATRDECTAEDESRLKTLLSQEPKKRKFARMLIVDATQPALAEHLGNRYPYAGLNTDEGISLFKNGTFRDFGM